MEKKITESIPEQGKYPVVQSNTLVEGQYKLDLIPQKIIRYLISEIRPSDETLKNKYRLVVKDFCDTVDREYETKVFQDIRLAAEKLLSTKITIKKQDRTIRTTWIASYEYPKNKGWFAFEFSSDLEDELLRLKDQFTKYYLKNISKLKSQYSIRIYELLQQYVSVGERTESIADLRAMLGLEENEYRPFQNFKKWILKPAHAEICKKTDIDFNFEVKKESRYPIAVRFFKIRQKTYISNRILSLISKKYQDNKQVLNTVRKYIELCGEDYIVEKLHYTNSRNPKRWTDYLWKACEYNYGEGYTPDQDTGTYVFVDTPEARAVAENRKKEKEQIEKLQQEYEGYKEKTIKKYLDTLDAPALAKLREGFEKSLNNRLLKARYEESGLESPMIWAEYMKYIYEKHIPADARVSFADFAKAMP